MPKKSKEILLNEIESRINQYNEKYGTNVQLSQVKEMVKEIDNFDSRSLESLRVMALSSYKKQYKNILKQVISNPTVQTNKTAINEIFDILDTAPYYLGDTVESMADHPNTITNDNIVIDADGKYVSDLQMKQDLFGIAKGIYGDTLEQADPDVIQAHADAQKQAYFKEYYTIHEWVNELEDYRSNDPDVENQKKVPIPTKGMMTKEERENFFMENIPVDVKESHYFKNAITESLKTANEYHLENIGTKARFAMEHTEADLSTQAGKKQMIENAGVYIQALMDKRSQRGFFGVLFHPFRSHAETVMIDTLTRELAAKVGENPDTLKENLQNNTIEIFDTKFKNALGAFTEKGITNAKESFERFDEVERMMDEKYAAVENSKDLMDEYEKAKLKTEALKKELEEKQRAFDEKYGSRVNAEIKNEEVVDNTEIEDVKEEVPVNEEIKEPSPLE